VFSNTPRPHSTLGKDLVPILQEAGWALGPDWTGGKSRPHRDSIPDRPARSQSLYRLSHRAHKTNNKVKVKEKLKRAWNFSGVLKKMEVQYKMKIQYKIRSCSMNSLDSPFLMGVLHLIAILEQPLLANAPSHF